MSEHAITLEWQRNTPDFNYETYSRNHTLKFGDAGRLCGSADPAFFGDPQCLDPEQSFIMSLSSCHMLTFLAIACKKGFVVDKYTDVAIAEMGKNHEGRNAIIKAILRPNIVFSGEKIPSHEEFKSLHERAHNGCIIANSIASCVIVDVVPTLTNI